MKKQRNGFTMVEVVMVLAIAGLIFLMAFIALPALQRQARDAQRKSDVAYFVDMAKKYQTNNRGALPIEGGDIVGKFREEPYLVDFVDPKGEEYDYEVLNCGEGGSAGDACEEDAIKKLQNWVSAGSEDSENILMIVQNAKCTGEEDSVVVFAPNSRKMAVLSKLEGGGIHCENS